MFRKSLLTCIVCGRIPFKADWRLVHTLNAICIECAARRAPISRRLTAGFRAAYVQELARALDARESN